METESVPTIDTLATIEAAERFHDVAPLAAEEFKLAFRGLAAGVAVITAIVDGERAAMTATSVTSLSATPPLVMFSASTLSSATSVIAQADTVVIHLLSARQVELAKLCATSGSDRFADIDTWRDLPTGEPHFPSVPVWIRGRVVNRFTAGSSVVHVVEALSSSIDNAEVELAVEAPLVYHNRTWHALDQRSAL